MTTLVMHPLPCCYPFELLMKPILDPLSESDLGSVPLTQAMIFRWEELISWQRPNIISEPSLTFLWRPNYDLQWTYYQYRCGRFLIMYYTNDQLSGGCWNAVIRHWCVDFGVIQHKVLSETLIISWAFLGEINFLMYYICISIWIHSAKVIWALSPWLRQWSFAEGIWLSSIVFDCL